MKVGLSEGCVQGCLWWELHSHPCSQLRVGAPPQEHWGGAGSCQLLQRQAEQRFSHFPPLGSMTAVCFHCPLKPFRGWRSWCGCEEVFNGGQSIPFSEEQRLSLSGFPRRNIDPVCHKLRSAGYLNILLAIGGWRIRD